MDKDNLYIESDITTEEVVTNGSLSNFINSEELAKYLQYISDAKCSNSLSLTLDHQSVYIDFNAFYDKRTQYLSKQLKKITDDSVKIKFAQLKNTLPVMVSLFFGLCCSSPTYIFDAIFGSSASRIPSI